MDKKQKAKELIESYLFLIYGAKKSYKRLEFEIAKKCILKLCDESIKACAFDRNISNTSPEYFRDELFITYWEQLKQEIENYE